MTAYLALGLFLDTYSRRYAVRGLMSPVAAAMKEVDLRPGRRDSMARACGGYQMSRRNAGHVYAEVAGRHVETARAAPG